MADTKREIERKYELPAPSDADERPGLPDLTGVKGVASVHAQGVVELDAVYYDTADLRLTADHVTLRRRTGGPDEGWHLKFPVSTGIRDEIRAPLADTLPDELAALVRSRVRGAGLIPVVRLTTSRDVLQLLDTNGTALAEASVDAVRARRLTGDAGGEDAGTASWTEVEVELGDDADPAILDAVEKKLRKAGLRPASAASKLGRALAETAPHEPGGAATRAPKGRPRSAGDHILAYLRDQADAIVAQDAAVRRDLPDSVHQLRVATRRMRSAFRTYRKILDRSVTDPVAEELKWVAAELGVDRDHEVLDERLSSRIDALPVTLLLGPVRGRLRTWDAAQRAGSRSRTVAVLDSERYLTLLDTLDGLLTAPPLRPDAARPAAKALPTAILKNYERLAGRVGDALALAPGEERDLAMHNARKAAKRARYAAEAAGPALGKAAKRFAKRMKALQTALGDHQDSVVARQALRDLAIQAHTAGESAFTWGLLYGQEEAQGERRERELPDLWAKASDPRLRADLSG
ncbi:CYTH and CHAD domain-containing protein [Streptomyces sp. 35G-GA-8]|uniref:CYTH and CHAD domain-containing protein n=1 Tax=Streptomyces sp. 35G-GA-8 TaxID=2939434 RepID=UPI00201F558E|nr:CYTH and CHAD domain-containing protein [Streptomyces sp. 35G-GA-8]MCL7377353.1 CYTH and CHAD domain-containing protein [Streptomyces sp. 35G-GA-8]